MISLMKPGTNCGWLKMLTPNGVLDKQGRYPG
jgi:hypothetical protein